MSRIIVFLFTFIFSFSVSAQTAPAKIAFKLRELAVVSPKYLPQDILPEHSINPVVNCKSVLDDIIGTSRYDNQCNGSMPNRMYLWPDGTISVTWMQGFLDGSGYSDRGTGYNYFDGTTWQASPTARIENNVRTGWPSLNPWMGNGEIIFAHNSTATLVMNSRPAKGTGTWTQSPAPTAPPGVTALLWPSVVTSGDNHQNIHILAIGQPGYQGMSDALLYFRSTDGGATWDQ